MSALQYNKSITELELAGNNIPQDVHKAIGRWCSVIRPQTIVVLA